MHPLMAEQFARDRIQKMRRRAERVSLVRRCRAPLDVLGRLRGRLLVRGERRRTDAPPAICPEVYH